MRIGELIFLVALLSAPPAWGAQPTAGDLAVGEALQQEVTVEPERITHQLLEPMKWVVTPPPRPHPLPATFPAVTSPPTAAEINDRMDE